MSPNSTAQSHLVPLAWTSHGSPIVRQFPTQHDRWLLNGGKDGDSLPNEGCRAMPISARLGESVRESAERIVLNVELPLAVERESCLYTSLDDVVAGPACADCVVVIACQGGAEDGNRRKAPSHTSRQSTHYCQAKGENSVN